MFTLTTHYTDGTVQHRTTVEAADEREALSWALTNWTPSRGYERATGGFYLNPVLRVDGVPIADVLARLNMRRAA